MTVSMVAILAIHTVDCLVRVSDWRGRADAGSADLLLSSPAPVSQPMTKRLATTRRRDTSPRTTPAISAAI